MHVQTCLTSFPGCPTLIPKYSKTIKPYSCAVLVSFPGCSSLIPMLYHFNCKLHSWRKQNAHVFFLLVNLGVCTSVASYIPKESRISICVMLGSFLPQEPYDVLWWRQQDAVCGIEGEGKTLRQCYSWSYTSTFFMSCHVMSWDSRPHFPIAPAQLM